MALESKTRLPESNFLTAIGLMSGTSMDGIDVALIKSNGHRIIRTNQNFYLPYPDNIQDSIRDIITETDVSLSKIKETENILTQYHVDAVLQFLDKFQIYEKDINVLGFHGQTIYHNPSKSITWQLGNPQLLASKTGINVIADFRTNNVMHGGEGAPLVPIYHKALTQSFSEDNTAFLNIGGVSNLTYIDNQNDVVFGFDTGPGNAFIDDYIYKATGQKYDRDGVLSCKGQVNENAVQDFLKHPYFSKSLPKSLDRNEFTLPSIESLSLEDALATLSTITAACVKANIVNTNLNDIKTIVVCGGGRKNQRIVNELKNYLEPQINIMIAEDFGLDGDFIEAEAFGYLAIRSLMNLPIFLNCNKKKGSLSTTNQNESSLLDQSSEQYNPLRESPSSFYGGVFYRA